MRRSHKNTLMNQTVCTNRHMCVDVMCPQVFEGRADHLLYRSINIVRDADATAKGIARAYLLPSPDSKPGGGSIGDQEQVVYKMTEKFARNPRKFADTNVAKRTYYVAEGRIRTLYHYGSDSVTRASQVQFKDNRMNHASSGAPPEAGGSSAGGSGSLTGDSGGGSLLSGGRRGSGAMGGKAGEGRGGGQVTAVETLQEVVTAEKECFTAARHLYMEMLDLARSRHAEESHVVLLRPIFESARDGQANAAADKLDGAGKDSRDDGGSGARQLDYLSPFLHHTADKGASGLPLSREDAARARDACLRALKERLLERANIINARLNEENAQLAKRQAAFQRNQRDNDGAAEEEFERFCAEAMFRIQIMEQRLVQHEESALRKYAELDRILAADPRLSALR